MLINNGFILMVVGVGTVFAFLILLWGVMSVCSRIYPKLFPKIFAETPDAASADGEDDAAIAAAIAFAAKCRRDGVPSNSDVAEIAVAIAAAGKRQRG